MRLAAATLATLTLLSPSALARTPRGCAVPDGRRVESVKTSRPWVSVTFDESLGRYTRPILRTFDRFRARSTFFMVGKNADARPALARAVLRHGNELGDHTYSHATLTDQPDSGYREYRRGLRSIRRATGFRPCLARPPGGKVDRGVVRAARRLGMRTVLWDVFGGDMFTTDSDRIARRVLREAHRGSIVILHQVPQSLDALPMILRGLRHRGLRSVTVTRLLGGRMLWR